MLNRINQFHGYKLGALDGQIGHVKDFYFDDREWAVRYLVADTGSWMPGRLVLLSPRAFAKPDHDKRVLRVNLTRRQIEGSPSIESHKPVSRQFEQKYHQYYGWPYYWSGDALWGMSGFPILTELPGPFAGEPAIKTRAKQKTGDAHLRSANAVKHYKIQAQDGFIGHVSDLVVTDETWAIHDFIVRTGAWLSGKDVLISPSRVKGISWNDSKIIVDLDKEAILRAPLYEESSLNASRAAALPHEMSIFV